MSQLNLDTEGLTLQSLADAFIDSFQKTEMGSEDMDTIMDFIIKEEHMPPKPDTIKSIENVMGTPFSAYSIHLLKDLKIKITPSFLAFLCTQTSGIPDCVSTYIGLISVYFYQRFPRESEMTLRWWCDLVGKGKLITFNDLHPYFLNLKRDSKFIFDTITEDELYTYKK